MLDYPDNKNIIKLCDEYKNISAFAFNNVLDSL